MSSGRIHPPASRRLIARLPAARRAGTPRARKSCTLCPSAGIRSCPDSHTNRWRCGQWPRPAPRHPRWKTSAARPSPRPAPRGEGRSRPDCAPEAGRGWWSQSGLIDGSVVLDVDRVRVPGRWPAELNNRDDVVRKSSGVEPRSPRRLRPAWRAPGRSSCRPRSRTATTTSKRPDRA